MHRPRRKPGPALRTRVLRALDEPQHRDALWLVVNTGAMALAGFLFWLVVTRVAQVPEAAVGHGYAIIALGTAIGVLAKGGFDTALVRHAPGADRAVAMRLLWASVGLGVLAAVALTGLAALAAWAGLPLPTLSATGWALVAAIGALLLVTWLQDAAFAAEREARLTVGRNLAASFARIALPIALVALAFPHAVELAWALALALAALVGLVLYRRLPQRDGGVVPGHAFLRTAARNFSASAAEFLPGLLLAPLVLAVGSPQEAAHFGIAWMLAALLFQVSGAIGRSALVAFAKDPEGHHPHAVRRGIAQTAMLVAPAALVIALGAPWLLALFGPGYPAAATALSLLAVSAVVVTPAALYLSVLRARETVLPLVALPAATVAALFLLAPALLTTWGVTGVAAAWVIANTPFGAWSIWRLSVESREVMDNGTTALCRRPHAG